MRNGTTYSLAAGAMILALLLGNALSGISVVGYHPECTDGIDNDQDSAIDGMDFECAEYPYADGNGESGTPVGDRYSEDNYKSFFEYHRDYMDPLSQEQIDQVCANIQFGTYDDQDGEAADSWATENNVNCEAGGP